MGFGTTFPLSQYQGAIKVGDLISIKPGMLLDPHHGPVLVLAEVTADYSWEVMYTTTGYITTVDRLDIAGVVSAAG